MDACGRCRAPYSHMLRISVWTVGPKRRVGQLWAQRTKNGSKTKNLIKIIFPTFKLADKIRRTVLSIALHTARRPPEGS